jgi:hypothetical protein
MPAIPSPSMCDTLVPPQATAKRMKAAEKPERGEHEDELMHGT